MKGDELFLSIIEKNFFSSEMDTSEKLETFYNNCFKDLIDELDITDYQSRAVKTGYMFEYAFVYVIEKLYNLKIVRGVELPSACMCGSGKLDFAIFEEEEIASENTLLAGIEAKGSDPESSQRPGLKRTDTIKKGISQAYQFKRIFPNKLFFIVSNFLPQQGNSKCMLDLSEGDIVDKYINVTNIQELNYLVEMIKSRS